MKEDVVLSPVVNVRRFKTVPAFYKCAVCGRSIPPRRFTQKSLGNREGVLCSCGGKQFRYENHPSVFRQIIHLIFHPGLFNQTVLCPKRWRIESE